MKLSNLKYYTLNKYSFPTLVICCVIWILFDQALNFIHTEVSIVLFFSIIPCLLTDWSELYSSEKSLILLTVLFFVLITIYKLLGVSTSSFESFSGYYSWGIMIISGVLVNTKFLDRQRKIIFYMVLITTIFNLMKFYIDSIGKDYLYTVLIANAAYSGMIMLFSGCCFIWFLHENRKLIRICVSIIMLIAVYVNITVLQRGTNFILTLVMFGIIFLQSPKNKKYRQIVYFFVIILLLVFFGFGIFEMLLDKFIDVLDYRLAKRVMWIKDFLKTWDFAAAEGFSGRVDLMAISFSTWLTSIVSFLFGAGDNRMDNLIIGNHSEFIDSFARFGIFGGVLVVILFANNFRVQSNWFSSINNTSFKAQMQTVYVIYMIRNLIGTSMAAPIAVIMLCFLPMLETICRGNRIEGRI